MPTINNIIASRFNGFSISGGGGGNTVVVGGTSFPDWDSVLASTSLSEGDYISIGESVYRWRADDGVSGTGRPWQQAAYVQGTPTERLRVNGDETQDTDLTSHGWSGVVKSLGGDVTYQGNFVRFDCPADGDTAYLNATTAYTGDWWHFSGYMRVPLCDTDVEQGYRICTHKFLSSSENVLIFPVSDNGFNLNFGSSSLAPREDGVIDTTPVSDTEWEWVEYLMRRSTAGGPPGPILLCWRDHKLVASASSTRKSSGSIVRYGADAACGVGRSDLKDCVWHTIAP